MPGRGSKPVTNHDVTAQERMNTYHPAEHLNHPPEFPSTSNIPVTSSIPSGHYTPLTPTEEMSLFWLGSRPSKDHQPRLASSAACLVSPCPGVEDNS